ncbi:MAG: biopolymer transporter ExbD [Mucilaginibacter sp.]
MAELNLSSGNSGSKHLKKMPVRVDLTAMVDLAFLLITFFMLTTSLAKPRAMLVAMPADSPPGGVPLSRSMTICLGKNNQVLYYLGMADKPLTGPKLTSSTKGIRNAIIETQKHVLAATGKSLIVLVKPDKNSIYSNLVDALDELNITGVQTYAIVNIDAKDIELMKKQGVY